LERVEGEPIGSQEVGSHTELVSSIAVVHLGDLGDQQKQRDAEDGKQIRILAPGYPMDI
jgi:hypothetical protein